MPDIVEALAECLEAMRGGADMNTCLAIYPEYREELRPLLAIVRLIRPLPTEVRPSQSFQGRTRDEILGRQEGREEVFLAPD